MRNLLSRATFVDDDAIASQMVLQEIMVLGRGAGERDVATVDKQLAQVVVVVDDVTTVLSGSVPRSRLVGNRELTSRVIDDGKFSELY